jgi:prolyl-tRNA synthetase
MEYAYATSWGASTRLVGGVIMTHGDDKGLRLPPAVAPVQVVVVPIYKNDDERARVAGEAHAVAASLAGLRVRVDDRDEHRPGFKFNEWELKGVPVRVELGPRDLDAMQATVFRRDTGEKAPQPLAELGKRLPVMLDEIQGSLFAQASAFLEENSYTARDYGELTELLLGRGGFVSGAWCGSPDCEAKVKAETKATIRYLPLDPEPMEGACVVCGRPAVELATWAQAY